MFRNLYEDFSFEDIFSNHCEKRTYSYQCPNGHNLEAFKVPKDSYGCNATDQNHHIQKGSIAFGCR